MSVKTSVAEFQAFLNDENFWPKNAILEDEAFKIDTVHGIEIHVYDTENLAPETNIEITGGYVMRRGGDVIAKLGDFFEKWRMQRNKVFFIVECEKSDFESVKQMLEKSNAKILCKMTKESDQPAVHSAAQTRP
jgi:hypothetical protein